MSENNFWLTTAILAFLAGAGAFLIMRQTRPDLIWEQTNTARRVEDIRENFRRSVERGEKIVDETKRRVVVNRERVVEAVRRASDDAVADLLNAELGLWRVEDGSGGLDDS